MSREIGAIGDRKDRDEEPLQWKPWQPPVMPPVQLQPNPVTQGDEDGAIGRVAGDSNGTGELDLGLNDPSRAARINLDTIAIPFVMTPQVQATAEALGELGTVGAIGQVATAIARTPFGPGGVAEALGRFADTFTRTTDQLLAVPGVGDALQVFGGVAGVVAGASGLKRELDEIAQKGLGPEKALGVAAKAAQLVGGVAMALSPLCPALAPVGAAIMTAGAGLSLGKLGWEHRDDIKGAAEGAAKVVASNTARIMANNGAAIVANNASRIVSEHGVGSPAWGWVTG